ncbi:MAG TPA: ATP-binding protein [Pirellulales bacterium]|jgi:DNA replication protein DnaC
MAKCGRYTAEQIEKYAADAEARAENNRREVLNNRLEFFMERVGERYRSCSLDSYKVSHDAQKPIVEAVRGYVENLSENYKNGINVVLYGPPGTGKDFLAVAIAKRAIEIGMTIEWRDGLALFADFRSAADFDSHTTEDHVVHTLVESNLLLLSDPIPPSVPGSDRSRGALTDYTAGCLLRVVDGRYRAMRPIIVTLNVSSGVELQERLGGAIYDRLRHDALCLACNWPSHRKPQGASDAK